jgi:hypothetical protein
MAAKKYADMIARPIFRMSAIITTKGYLLDQGINLFVMTNGVGQKQMERLAYKAEDTLTKRGPVIIGVRCVSATSSNGIRMLGMQEGLSPASR